MVRPRSWKKLDSWSFGGRLFRVLFNIFFFCLANCSANFGNKITSVYSVVGRNESDWSVFLVGSPGCLSPNIFPEHGLKIVLGSNNLC